MKPSREIGIVDRRGRLNCILACDRGCHERRVIYDDAVRWWIWVHYGPTDLITVVAFLVVGLVAFLAPVVGYKPGRSAALTASLYLLVSYFLVSIVQIIG